MRKLGHVEKDHLKKKTDSFRVGDTVRVHMRIVEGEKERIQVFQGVLVFPIVFVEAAHMFGRFVHALL